MPQSTFNRVPVSQVSPGLCQPLYFDRLAQEYPTSATIPGALNYPGGNANLLATVTEGSTAATVTGGDDLADFGAGPFSAVLEDPNASDTDRRWYPCIVVSIVGNAIEMIPPAPFSGVAVPIHNRHEAANGQHETIAGNALLADLLYFSPASSLGFGPSLADVGPDYEWVSPGFLPASHVNYWQFYGGVATNAHDWLDVANLESDGRVHTENIQATEVDTDADGEGLTYILEGQYGAGIFSVSTGHRKADMRLDCQVELLADDDQVFLGTFQGAVKRWNLPFPPCKKLECRVTAIGNETRSIRIGRVIVSDTPNQRPAFLQTDKVLLVGDSWVSSPSYPGLQMRLQQLLPLPIVTEGVDGTDSNYPLVREANGLTRLENWIHLHKPTAVLYHSYINDRNNGVTREDWAANLRAAGDICQQYGVQSTFVLPGATGSTSQTQECRTLYDKALGVPSRQNETVINGYSLELGSAICWVNNVGKYPGRVIYDLSTQESFAASGSSPTAAWQCISDNSVPDYIPT